MRIRYSRSSGLSLVIGFMSLCGFGSILILICGMLQVVDFDGELLRFVEFGCGLGVELPSVPAFATVLNGMGFAV